MLIIYNIAIRGYALLASIYSLFNSKARLWIKGRKQTKKTLQNWQRPVGTVLWVHAASLGEYEMAVPVVRALRQKSPEKTFSVVVTFFSPSGAENVSTKSDVADEVWYLPLDTRGNAKRMLTTLKPNLAFFMKYEFWWHYFHELRRREIPFFVLGARFYSEQYFFKWYGKPFTQLLKLPTRIYVQRLNDIALGKKLRLDNLELGGDTRFQRTKELVKEEVDLDWMHQFKADKKLIVFGSSWQPEEKIARRFIEEFGSYYKYLIAPHEMDDQRIDPFLQLSAPAVRYTKRNSVSLENQTILILDEVGLLAHIYKYANIAFVGGGFGVGLHNVLEPLVFKVPVIVGPDLTGFREATEGVHLNIIRSVSNYTEFLEAFREIMDMDVNAFGKRVEELYNQDLQSFDVMIDALENYLPSTTS